MVTLLELGAHGQALSLLAPTDSLQILALVLWSSPQCATLISDTPKSTEAD